LTFIALIENTQLKFLIRKNELIRNTICSTSINLAYRIDATDAGNGIVKIRVRNEMGWSSATRIPGTDTPIIYNKDRSVIGPGAQFTKNSIGIYRIPMRWFHNKTG